MGLGLKTKDLQSWDHNKLIGELGPEALQQSGLLLVMLGGGDDGGDAAGHGPSMTALPPTGKSWVKEGKGSDH